MKTPAFLPLGNRYLVLPDPIGQETETIGGVTLSRPKDENKQADEGTVVAKGKSCVDVEVGSKVYYGRYSGYDRKIGGVDYKIFQENELLGEHLVTPFDQDQPALPLVMGELVGGETIPLKAYPVSNLTTHILSIREATDEERSVVEDYPVRASTPGTCGLCGKPADSPTSTWCNDCMPF